MERALLRENSPDFGCFRDPQKGAKPAHRAVRRPTIMWFSDAPPTLASPIRFGTCSVTLGASERGTSLQRTQATTVCPARFFTDKREAVI